MDDHAAHATGDTRLHPLVPVSYRVVARRRETADVVTLDLAPVDEAIAPLAPGQFAMMYVPGVGEAPISVSGCPGEDGVISHTIRACGIVSSALTTTEVGGVVGLRGPFGRGWPLDAAAGRELFVVGGGIGLAPLRPLVAQAVADRRIERVAVAIGARQPDQLLFTDDLRDWEGAGASTEVVVDIAPPGWTGEVGVVTDAFGRLLGDPASTVAMVCGPEIMLRVAAYRLLDAGVDPADVYVSIERNMHCGVGHCGHCQLGPVLTCLDGPVLPWSTVGELLEVPRW